MAKRLFRVLKWTAGLSLAFVGVVGFAHTEAGRGLLRYLPSPGSACPLGYDQSLGTEQRDVIRASLLAPQAGEAPAGSRDVLAFSLGETSREQITAWIAEQGVECEAVEAGNAFRCQDVPASSIARPTAATSLLLRFSAAGTLVTVDASFRGEDPEVAATHARQQSASLRSSMGPHASQKGEFSASYLSKGALATAGVEFRFSDVRANVSATNLGRGRYLARESYQAFDDPA